MIRSFTRISVLLLILGASIKCQPRMVDPTPVGILVIDTVCSHYVIELIQGSIDASRIVPEWKDPNTNIVYVNAFTVANPCTFARDGVAVGEKFSFEFGTAGPADTCAICQIFYPTPAISNMINVIHKID